MGPAPGSGVPMCPAPSEVAASSGSGSSSGHRGRELGEGTQHYGESQLVAMQQKCPGDCFVCARCRTQKPMGDMDKNRRNCCSSCNASYKALTTRWGKERHLKLWWEALTMDQQVFI
jgi:hypothetical protein